MESDDPPPRSLTQFSQMAMLCLYHHRLVTTGQLRRLLLPGTRSTYLHRELRQLRQSGLIDAVSRGRCGEHAWFTTPAGAHAVEHSADVPPRAYRMTKDHAGGPLQAHTLAVVETGIAFVEAARRLGHECGPLDWTPEVAHRIRDSGRFNDSHLITDALLNYVVVDAHARRRDQLQFFIELDRATMTITRLATKIAAYARYYDYVPGASGAYGRRASRTETSPTWRHRYPRFPRLLIVLTGKSETLLFKRRGDLTAHLAALPLLDRPRTGFNVTIATLRQLDADDFLASIGVQSACRR